MAQRQFKSTDSDKWTEKYGNKSDGIGSIDTSTFAEANETFTGTSGESTGTAGGTSIATNDLVLIHQTQGTGAGAWELNKVTSGGSTSLTFKYALCNTYVADAQILKLKQYSALTVNSGQTWTDSAWDGSKGSILACLVNGVTTITGGILATGKGFQKGGTVSSGLGEGQQAHGTKGEGGTASAAANGNGGGGGDGGGGNEAGAGGGGGGNATTGDTGQINVSGNRYGGTGGEIKGNAGLTLMVPGGGGGGGAGDGTTANGGSGGNGGGIIFIISKTITGTGTITLGGNAGALGSGGTTERRGCGGGGAGGSLLFKGQIIDVSAMTITALAGAGGGGDGSRTGGIGSVGRIHVDYLTTLTGTTTPTLDSTKDATLATAGGGGFLMNFI